MYYYLFFILFLFAYKCKYHTYDREYLFIYKAIYMVTLVLHTGTLEVALINVSSIRNDIIAIKFLRRLFLLNSLK